MPQPWTHTACLPVICKHSLQWVSCIFCVGRANTWLNKCCFEPLRVVIKAASFAAKSQPLFEFFGLKLLPGCWAQAAGRKIEPLQLLPLASPAALTSRVTCFHHPAAQRVFRQAAVVPSSCLLKTTSFLSCPGATHFSQPDRHRIFSRPPTNPKSACPPLLPGRFSRVLLSDGQLQKAPPLFRQLTFACPDLF